MTFFDCFNIANIELNKHSKINAVDIEKSVLAYDFSRANNDDDMNTILKYVNNMHKTKFNKYGKNISFGIKDLTGATKYNIFELINTKPSYISLTGAYSNELAGGYKEDGAFTSFGKYVFKIIEDNNIPVDVSELSESSFFEVVKMSTKNLIATHSCLNQNTKHLPFLKDYQTKILVEQKGLVCFLLEGRKTLVQTAEEINRFVEMYGTKNIGLGSGQKSIKHTDYYVQTIINILYQKGYPKAAIQDIFENNLKSFLGYKN